MNLRRLDRRKVEMSDAAMRALQTIASLDHLTAGEALERLIMDFLELRWDEITEMEEMMPPRPARPPAKVIDLGMRRSRKAVDRAHEIHDVIQRSRALRELFRAATRACPIRENLRAPAAAWRRSDLGPPRLIAHA